MRILLLGATGRTGRLLVKQALQRGHEVMVLVRNRSKIGITDPNLQVMQGHPADRACLDTAMKGCDAVISTLNISRYNDFPWAPLRTPKDFLSNVMSQVISLSDAHGIQRIIFTSAWGVGESVKDIPGWFRWLVRKSNLRYPYLDLYRTEELLRVTSLQWTAVRPTVLINAKKIRPAKVTMGDGQVPSLFISRASVASFMLDALEQNLYTGETPVISR
ncbi:NAD(P)H-binding protein [Terrimonas sp. NA20]|uniref:NAD(P)H-binding protein n=1 Tax=Terrimonas ginsenosidimutans TaxID=2908004 RepID=A0ABS9KWY0_9BACT|nr:NAD(P)H-binding protein [Terrimonas ginsenosidimutans]MCG2616874.1 NAD(P)H-binding protein [Terrimonas ginsenosidimutans]